MHCAPHQQERCSAGCSHLPDGLEEGEAAEQLFSSVGAHPGTFRKVDFFDNIKPVIRISNQSAWWNKYVGNTFSSSHRVKSAYLLVEENSQWFSRKMSDYVKLVFSTLRVMTFQVNSVLIVTYHMKVSFSIHSCIFPRFMHYILPLVTPT